jgi:uncharacterized protein YndB with AHSA1/START domain
MGIRHAVPGLKTMSQTGSGRLEAGGDVRWDWEMYDISIPVKVTVVEPNERIVIVWPAYSAQMTVEWTFDDRRDGTTFVTIRESGFVTLGDALIREVAASTQGFTLVLAGAKALLEHEIRLNLVADRYPDGRPGTSGGGIASVPRSAGGRRSEGPRGSI